MQKWPGAGSGRLAHAAAILASALVLAGKAYATNPDRRTGTGELTSDVSGAQLAGSAGAFVAEYAAQPAAISVTVTPVSRIGVR